MIKFKMTGAKEMDRALQELKTFTARRVGKRAMTKALEPVAADARANVPRSSDGKNMADSIAVGGKLTRAQAKEARSMQREGRHLMMMYVGLKEPHAHLVEFGTVERFHKSGKSVGVMQKSPFMRPAWDGNVGSMVETLAAELRIELDKAVARAARLGGRK